jgi:hypothetical protein
LSMRRASLSLSLRLLPTRLSPWPSTAVGLTLPARTERCYSIHRCAEIQGSALYCGQEMVRRLSTLSSSRLPEQFLPVPPANGVIDGTYAIANNSGYVFLFNPASRPLSTPPGLLTFNAASLGLACIPGDVFAVGEVRRFRFVSHRTE